MRKGESVQTFLSLTINVDEREHIVGYGGIEVQYEACDSRLDPYLSRGC